MPNGPASNRLSGYIEVITKDGLGPHTAVRGNTEGSREKRRNPGNGGMSQRGHRNHVRLTWLRWHLTQSSTPVKGPGFRPSKRPRQADISSSIVKSQNVATATPLPPLNTDA